MTWRLQEPMEMVHSSSGGWNFRRVALSEILRKKYSTIVFRSSSMVYFPLQPNGCLDSRTENKFPNWSLPDGSSKNRKGYTECLSKRALLAPPLLYICIYILMYCIYEFIYIVYINLSSILKFFSYYYVFFHSTSIFLFFFSLCQRTKHDATVYSQILLKAWGW